MTVLKTITRLQITMFAGLAMLGCAGAPNTPQQKPDKPQATSEPATKESAPARPRPVSPRNKGSSSARVLVAQARQFNPSPTRGKS
jgi:hypothetical protein